MKEAVYFAQSPSGIRYRADDALVAMSRWPWKRPQLAAMYMPRALSRYTLEIAEVRVQRLDEIDDRDADAEGVETMDGILDEADICRLAKSFPACGYEDGRAWYAATWEHIHGSGSWERDRALARGSMVCSSSHERWCSESSTGHPACTLRTPAACTEMASSTR